MGWAQDLTIDPRDCYCLSSYIIWLNVDCSNPMIDNGSRISTIGMIDPLRKRNSVETMFCSDYTKRLF